MSRDELKRLLWEWLEEYVTPDDTTQKVVSQFAGVRPDLHARYSFWIKETVQEYFRTMRSRE